MAQLESILTSPLPRPLLVIGTPIAAVLLTSFFILLGFPYHHLTSRAAAQVSASLGVEIEAADSGLTFGLDGPGFRFQDVSVETPMGEIYELDSASFGLAWSLSWLTLTPTIFFELHSPLGDVKGIHRTGDDTIWSGSIGDLDLAKLTFLETLLPVKLTGTLNAEGNVETQDGIPRGPVSFNLKDGLIEHPNMAIEIPYTSIEGTLAFGAEQQFVNIASFDLLGPMLNFSISGTIGQAEPVQDGALDLLVSFKNVSPRMRTIVEALGGKLGRDGSAKIQIGGTIGIPEVE